MSTCRPAHRAGDPDGVVDRRQMAALELDVDDRTDDLDDLAGRLLALLLP